MEITFKREPQNEMMDTLGYLARTLTAQGYSLHAIKRQVREQAESSSTRSAQVKKQLPNLWIAIDKVEDSDLNYLTCGYGERGDAAAVYFIIKE